VRLHELPRAGGVARFDERDEPAMRFQNPLRHRPVQRAVAAGPRDVLQRDQLVVQHAVMRSLGNAEVELQA
jgi:hypothetical protein